MQEIYNSPGEFDKDEDGYTVAYKRLDVNGHDVLVVLSEGSQKVTVFVDGSPKLLSPGLVEGWITARTR